MRKDRDAHARFPELPDVIRNSRDSFLLALVGEELADLIGHVYGFSGDMIHRFHLDAVAIGKNLEPILAGDCHKGDAGRCGNPHRERRR